MYIIKKRSYSPYCFLPNAQVSETKRRASPRLLVLGLGPTGASWREGRALRRGRRRPARVPRRPRYHQRQPDFSESRDDNVRRRQQDGDGSDDGEQSKND